MTGDREYVNIPGNEMHELPPLLVRRASGAPDVDLASAILEAEEMLPEVDVEETLLERRKMDLALTLTEQYRGLIAHLAMGRIHRGVDPAVRNHLPVAIGATRSPASGCVAPRQPQQLCDPAGR